MNVNSASMHFRLDILQILKLTGPTKVVVAATADVDVFVASIVE